ncbi:MAG: helix-turn-helix transcriptional regulator [Clostridia bacterium]|nr:helix-turn-helix transcriptional regulator [Clostridia bacterium]
MEMNIGNKIRELRKKRGITQEQLASALGITSQAVSKWEMSTGYPDIAMLPVISGYFGVSMDTLFNYDADKLEEKIMEVLYHSRVDAHTFEETEKILLEGIAAYPSGYILKRELLEEYAGQIRAHDRTDLIEKALELGKQICEECEDSFIYLGVMGDMADIYITTGRYEEGKKLIESMPYRYHLDIYDRMRCTSMFLNDKDRLHETREWKRWAHQELHMVCEAEGFSFFAVGDYENALWSFEEAADLIERFWRRPIPDEYALLQSPYVPQGLCVLAAAGCLYKLGRLEECDAMMERAYHLIRDYYNDELWEKCKEQRMKEYRAVYCKVSLDEYKPCM